MERSEIEKILPHRGGMLLLDSVVLDGEWAVGSYTVKGDEFFLQGHFPSFPIVPGVILCEILAQTACILIEDAGEGGIPVYAGLDKVRFRSPVRPGDTITTRCRIKRKLGTMYFAQGEGHVSDKLAIKAEFSFAIVDGSLISGEGS